MTRDAPHFPSDTEAGTGWWAIVPKEMGDITVERSNGGCIEDRKKLYRFNKKNFKKYGDV